MDSVIRQLLEKKSYSIDDLVAIVRVLRSENGCPWDKVQTHKTIKKDLLEETYEVLEAIDCDSPEMMREELGDVLLQVVFHTVLESEKAHFELEDVTNDVCRKLIVRHPHVFGDVDVDGVDDVLRNWDTIKMNTKGQETFTDTLKSVPRNFPALMRAQKLGKRAAKSGFDFESAQQAFDGLKSEVEEVEAVLDDKEKAAEELGDLMFSCVNVARKLDLDAQELLTSANDKFLKRFEKLEKLTLQDGEDITKLTPQQLEQYWQRAKKVIDE
ncbi:MAG: nucleoside triphosphate pyrophosphohydrolase [Ruminococcus sp.]|nr:nucleoside triphosphate pyrophosphohydrolase [Ruminococcus sp.]